MSNEQRELASANEQRELASAAVERLVLDHGVPVSLIAKLRDALGQVLIAGSFGSPAPVRVFCAAVCDACAIIDREVYAEAVRKAVTS